MASLPLVAGSPTWATLDLFVDAEHELYQLSIPDAVAVAEVVGSLMQSMFESRSPAGHGHNPFGAARAVKMTAMGMSDTAYDLTAEQALTVLRAHATDVGMTVEALADALVHLRHQWGEIPVDDPAGALTHQARSQLIRRRPSRHR